MSTQDTTLSWDPPTHYLDW